LLLLIDELTDEIILFSKIPFPSTPTEKGILKSKSALTSRLFLQKDLF